MEVLTITQSWGPQANFDVAWPLSACMLAMLASTRPAHAFPTLEHRRRWLHSSAGKVQRVGFGRSNCVRGRIFAESKGEGQEFSVNRREVDLQCTSGAAHDSGRFALDTAPHFGVTGAPASMTRLRLTSSLLPNPLRWTASFSAVTACHVPGGPRQRETLQRPRYTALGSYHTSFGNP